MPVGSSSRDRFAELYVAGILSDNGWNVYLPLRDEGIDFVIIKSTPAGVIIRPVQVKGKYPEEIKTAKTVYGYVGRLTQLHDRMVLAIPYFTSDVSLPAPTCIAFMPHSQIRPHSRGFRCEPATFDGICASPRRDYQQYFGQSGMKAMESLEWA